jgi:hypothetical protein
MEGWISGGKRKHREQREGSLRFQILTLTFHSLRLFFIPCHGVKWNHHGIILGYLSDIFKDQIRIP